MPQEYQDDLVAPVQQGGVMTIGPEMYAEAAQPGVTIGPEVGMPDGTLEPSEDGSLAPVEQPAPATPAEPEARSRTPILLAAAGVLLIGGGAAAAAMGGLAFLSSGGDETGAVEQAEGLADAPDEEPVPEPVPAPDEAPEGEPDPTPTPSPVQAPGPEPAPSGSAEAPEPAPTENPEPTVAPEPEAEPEGTADPAAGTGSGATGSILVDSDVTLVFRDASGAKVDPSSVTPGTYSIIAFFKEGVPTEQGTVTVTEGKTPTVKCLGARQICRVL